MITCDLCGKEKDRLQKEIDGKVYDICSDAGSRWRKKLKGKGREKSREMVLLPPRTIKEREEEEPKPHSLPGGAPVIQCEALPS